jgi:hypothetical protein
MSSRWLSQSRASTATVTGNKIMHIEAMRADELIRIRPHGNFPWNTESAMPGFRRLCLSAAERRELTGLRDHGPSADHQRRPLRENKDPDTFRFRFQGRVFAKRAQAVGARAIIGTICFACDLIRLTAAQTRPTFLSSD